MYRICCLLICFCMIKRTSAQSKTDQLLTDILNTNSNSHLQQVVTKPEKYRLQIIYTQIDRSKNNQPSFHNYYFHYDPSQYFNPASMVKMPLAFLALEKLNALKQK